MDKKKEEEKNRSVMIKRFIRFPKPKTTHFVGLFCNQIQPTDPSLANRIIINKISKTITGKY